MNEFNLLSSKKAIPHQLSANLAYVKQLYQSTVALQVELARGCKLSVKAKLKYSSQFIIIVARILRMFFRLIEQKLFVSVICIPKRGFTFLVLVCESHKVSVLAFLLV